MRFRAEYLKLGGVFCPFCKKADIEGGFVDIIEGNAFQTVSCTNCDASWQDRYNLVDAETVCTPEEIPSPR